MSSTLDRSRAGSRTALLAAALLLVPGVASAATVLRTSELTALGGAAVSCAVTNGGTSDAIVTIQVIESTGVAIQTEPSLTVAPEHGVSARAAGNVFSRPHCKVTIEKGAKKNIHAALCIHSGGSSLSSPCTATSEAR